MKIVRVFLSLLLIFGLSSAADYYVSPSGDDSNNGSINNPWRTIQHASNSVNPGDTVYIKEGTYSEQVVFQTSGASEALINITGATVEKVIVSGSLEFGQGTSYLNISHITVKNFPGWGVFFRGQNEHIIISGFEIIGGESGLHFTYGYSAQEPLEGPVSDVTIKDSLIKDSIYTGVDCTPGPCDSMRFINLEVTGCGLSIGANYGSDGIAVERGENILVEGCYIHDNAGDGIDLNSRDFSGNVPGIVVRRNSVIQNHLTGIKLWSGGLIENNVVWGQGNTPVSIGAYPGTYEVINNTIAYNMWDASYSTRNYSFVAGYPNDETGIPAEMDLALINNIFAFNTGPNVGSPTGIYLGSGVNLTEEGHNIYWSRDEGEIQAEFVQGDPWFSREQIKNGSWAKSTGQGKGNICSNPLFVSGWPGVNLQLQELSPAVDSGTSEGTPSVDNICMKRPAGSGTDIGAYEINSSLDPDCEAKEEEKKKKKGGVRR